MPKINVVHAAFAGFWVSTFAACAQSPVVYAPLPPSTKLEILETNTGIILIKATALVGSMSVDGAALTVTCKEDTDAGTGRKEQGIVLGVTSAQTSNLEDRTIVDYDELGSLLDAIDALAKIDWSVTSLSGFDAVYQTRGGFGVAAFSARRSGSIEYRVRSIRMGKGIVLGQSQLAEFRGLIDQARRKLDDLRAK